MLEFNCFTTVPIISIKIAEKVAEKIHKSPAKKNKDMYKTIKYAAAQKKQNKKIQLKNNYQEETTMKNTENKGNQAGTFTAAAREAYESKVGIEAVERIGRNKNVKGVVHEILVKDRINANPANILNGKKAVLSESTTAVRDDVLVKQGGKIVERMQLKDTSKSIGDTIKQVGSKHYVGTKLVGTNETAKAYTEAISKAADKGVKVTQKMTSSGISSSDTARIATKTIGTSAGKLTASSVAKAAGSSGIAGAAISGGIEIVSSGKKLLDGEIDGKEFVTNVAKETAGGGISAAAGTTAAAVVTTGAATVLATTTAPLWVVPAIGIATTVAVGAGVKKLWDKFTR